MRGKQYLTAGLLGVCMMLLLAQGQHYTLYIRSYGESAIVLVTEQLAYLQGVVTAWLSALSLYRHAPLAVVTAICCCVYTACTNVFVHTPGAIWSRVITAWPWNWSKSLLDMLFSYKVASAAHKPNSSVQQRTAVLHASFAIYYGLSQISQILSAVFNLYLTSEEMTISSILSRRLETNSTEVQSCRSMNSTGSSMLALEWQQSGAGGVLKQSALERQPLSFTSYLELPQRC